MNSQQSIAQSYTRWLDLVAETVVAATGRLSFPRMVRVEEGEGGAFAINAGSKSTLRLRFIDGSLVGASAQDVANTLRGSRVELVLNSNRFLFRPLELPKRATEFLDGIVRAQIDRLTPWTAADAVFGCSKPSEAGPDRMAITVAATSRAQVMPLVEALAGLGAESVSVSTQMQGADGDVTSIKVLDQRSRAALDVARVRRVLAACLVLAAITAATSVTAATIIASTLGSRQEELARRISERRAQMRASNDGSGVALTPLRKLELRKHQTPASVIALEVLSKTLPDHTYVTELRIEGDKLRVIGITRDAPGLIRLIEQSAHFTRATFFAPTTRQASDPGERFHIEARIEPVFSPRT